MIEEIRDGETLYAIVVRNEYSPDGVEFFTPGDFSQQLGFMQRPEGYEVDPHTHAEVVREVQRTQEVLFVREGTVRADIYDDDNDHLRSLTLNAGDVILLAGGGHGFEMLEDAEIIEVKQGPYLGDQDKTLIADESRETT